MKYQISSRSFLGSAVLAASLASSVALAAPHDPRVNPTVTPTPDTISLSRPTVGLLINGSYLFSVTNGTPANLNFVTFTATSTGAEIEAQVINLPADGVVDPSCVLDNATKITCSPGTLAPGKKLNFLVVIKSPTAGTSTNLNWTFAGSEGNSSNGCCIESGTATTALVDAMSSAAAKHVQSFVKASTVSTFFTGNGGVATKLDPWTTTVQVPVFAFAKYVTADVTESEVVSSCSPVSLQCQKSVITIPTAPGAFDSSPLLITFQQHPSIIKKGSKIENWVISYSKDPAQSPVAVEKCSVHNGPSPGIPCIVDNSCKEYTKQSDPGSPELWGIFECKAKASDNGSWEN